METMEEDARIIETSSYSQVLYYHATNKEANLSLKNELMHCSH